jgi:membrane glycosyltransferase
MGRIRDAVRRMGVVGELLNFLWRERLWWMIPILIALILVALLVVLGSNPAVAPFVYVLF